MQTTAFSSRTQLLKRPSSHVIDTLSTFSFSPAHTLLLTFLEVNMSSALCSFDPAHTLSAHTLPSHTQVLDEVSMLSAEFFQHMEAQLRAIRGNHNAAGGLQLVMCGDFFQ